MISRYIKRLNSLVYQLIFIYVIITVAAMCFSCRYSSLVSPSSSRRHGLFPRRAHAIYRSLAFGAGPVHQASRRHNDCKRYAAYSGVKIRGLTLPRNWSVILRPVKIHSRAQKKKELLLSMLGQGPD